MEIWGRTASKAMAISSGAAPMASATWLIPGSFPVFAKSSACTAVALAANSLRERLTLIMPSSRKKRLISPAIMGTA